MIIIGDYVKSLFNGVISRVTLNGDEPANTVAVDIANDPQMFRLATYSEINHLSEGEWMAICGNPLQYCIKKETISKELFGLVKDLKPNLPIFVIGKDLIEYTTLDEPLKVHYISHLNLFYDCAKWASILGYDIYCIKDISKDNNTYFTKVYKKDTDPFNTDALYTEDNFNSEYSAMYKACEWVKNVQGL